MSGDGAGWTVPRLGTAENARFRRRELPDVVAARDYLLTTRMVCCASGPNRTLACSRDNRRISFTLATGISCSRSKAIRPFPTKAGILGQVGRSEMIACQAFWNDWAAISSAVIRFALTRRSSAMVGAAGSPVQLGRA